MEHKCFISFKKEDERYKKAIQNLGVDMIDKSLDEPIDSDDENYIMQKIRDDYLSDSTVTIHLIGSRSAETLGNEEQKFIKRELQASLYDGENNTRSGILGIVLPEVHSNIYSGSSQCSRCGVPVSLVNMNDSIAVKEFHCNYYIPNNKCHYSEDERYCVLVSWNDFIENPKLYIEQAFAKRSEPIAKKVSVRPS